MLLLTCAPSLASPMFKANARIRGPYPDNTKLQRDTYRPQTKVESTRQRVDAQDTSHAHRDAMIHANTPRRASRYLWHAMLASSVRQSLARGRAGPHSVTVVSAYSPAASVFQSSPPTTLTSPLKTTPAEITTLPSIVSFLQPISDGGPLGTSLLSASTNL